MRGVSSLAILFLASLPLGCGSNSLTGQTGQGGHAGAGQAGTGGSAGGRQGTGGRGGTGGGTGGNAGGSGGSAGGAGGAGGQAHVAACSDTGATQPTGACHSVADCGPIGPVKCCTGGTCWPESACPIPPINCPTDGTTIQCATSQDCDAGGTCVTTTSGCPQCPHSACQYPAPLCTVSPDSCAPTGMCEPNSGKCAPLLCTNGWSCTTGTRCAIGSGRTDVHGCEPIPCDAGWSCAVNTRCTPPGDATNHGCVPLACTSDGDCDCGYCVNGTCGSNLGFCSFPPA